MTQKRIYKERILESIRKDGPLAKPEADLHDPSLIAAFDELIVEKRILPVPCKSDHAAGCVHYGLET